MSQRQIQRAQVKLLAAHAARVSSTTGTGVKLSADAGGHGALAIYHVSAVGGDADETLTPKIEGSNSDDSVADGSAVWVDAIAEGSYGVATQPTGAQTFAFRLKPFRRYRQKDTQAGTTPSSTYSIILVALAGKAPTTLPVAA